MSIQTSDNGFASDGLGPASHLADSGRDDCDESALRPTRDKKADGVQTPLRTSAKPSKVPRIRAPP